MYVIKMFKSVLFIKPGTDLGFCLVIYGLTFTPATVISWSAIPENNFDFLY